MIKHTVAFSLAHAEGSVEEVDFLNAALALADIPGVQNFQQLRQVSPKSNFTFAFFMDFDSEQAYRSYNDHPIHLDFVHNRWEIEVSGYSELDFVSR